jgi:hypothetical protein
LLLKATRRRRDRSVAVFPGPALNGIASNVRNPDVHKATDRIGFGGNAQRYRRLIRCRTAADVDDEPGIRNLVIAWRAAFVAAAHNSTSEDLFIKFNRSIDVRDGDKKGDGDVMLRRHLIAILVNLY